jgi:hypothetical protein
MYRRLHDYAAILGFVTGFLGAVLAVELVPVADETEVPAVVAAADDAIVAPSAEDAISRFAFAQGLEASVLEPAAPLALAEAVREALPEPVEALPAAPGAEPVAEPAAEAIAIAQLPEKQDVIAPRDDIVSVASAYSSEAPQVDPVAYTAIAGWSYSEAPEDQHDDPILLRLPSSAREQAEASVDERPAARPQRAQRADNAGTQQRTAARKIEAVWDHSLPKARGACYWNLVGELYFVCVD